MENERRRHWRKAQKRERRKKKRINAYIVYENLSVTLTAWVIKTNKFNLAFAFVYFISQIFFVQLLFAVFFD